MREIFNQLHQTGRPVIVTVNGKPDIVLLDAAVFDKQMKAINLSNLLAEAEKDIRAGHVRPMRAFLKSFKNAKKIPR